MEWWWQIQVLSWYRRDRYTSKGEIVQFRFKSLSLKSTALTHLLHHQSARPPTAKKRSRGTADGSNEAIRRSTRSTRRKTGHWARPALILNLDLTSRWSLSVRNSSIHHNNFSSKPFTRILGNVFVTYQCPQRMHLFSCESVVLFVASTCHMHCKLHYMRRYPKSTRNWGLCSSITVSLAGCHIHTSRMQALSHSRAHNCKLWTELVAPDERLPARPTAIIACMVWSNLYIWHTPKSDNESKRCIVCCWRGL